MRGGIPLCERDLARVDGEDGLLQMSAVDPTLGLALCNAVTAFQAYMACFA